MSREHADRVRDAMWAALEKKFSGNKAEFSRAIGRSPSGLNDLLQGTNNPSFETIARLAAVFEMSPADLLAGRATAPKNRTERFPVLAGFLSRNEGVVPERIVEQLRLAARTRGDHKTEWEWMQSAVAVSHMQALGFLGVDED